MKHGSKLLSGRVAALAAILAALPASAQQQPAAQQPAAQQPGAQAPRPSPWVIATKGTIPANPADVQSIDAIMTAVYDVISGPAGKQRNWDRMRSLFTANARIMPKFPTGLRSGSVEDYISSSGSMLETRGFTERETGRVVEQYGDIAHVFSAYEGRFAVGDTTPVRGINSFQLVRHDNRWWVVSIMWEAETAENPVPARYLNRPAR